MQHSDIFSYFTKPFKPYNKSRDQQGPAALPTALLLNEGLIKTVKHQEIKPAMSVKNMPKVNCRLMADRIDDDIIVYPDYVNTFIYAIEVLPFSYLSITDWRDHQYTYLNMHFKDFAAQFGKEIITKTLSDILPCEDEDSDEHPSVKCIKRIERRAYANYKSYWIEERAIDNLDRTHVFYTWQIPMFYEANQHKPMGIITLSIPFSHFPFFINLSVKHTRKQHEKLNPII